MKRTRCKLSSFVTKQKIIKVNGMERTRCKLNFISRLNLSQQMQISGYDRGYFAVSAANGFRSNRIAERPSLNEAGDFVLRGRLA